MIAFPVEPYKTQENSSWILNIASAANVSDLHYEVTSHYNEFHGKVKRVLKRNKRTDYSNGHSSENTGLLVGQEEDEDIFSNDGIFYVYNYMLFIWKLKFWIYLKKESFCEEDDIGPRVLNIRRISGGGPSTIIEI